MNANTTPLRPFAEVRLEGYSLLRGEGLEIGGLENPAPLGPRCRVTNCDLVTTEEARRRFPELEGRSLPKVERFADLDAGGLWMFGPGSQDFVVCNHVLEHLYDPIAALREFLRVTRPGGHLVLTVPDHRYIFDRACPPTPWPVLRRRFTGMARTPSPTDYAALLPRAAEESQESYEARLAERLQRREHLNAWTSDGFLDFLAQAWLLLGAAPTLRFAAPAETNNLECFTIWEV